MIESILFSESINIKYSSNDNVVKYLVPTNNYSFSLSEFKLNDPDIVRVIKYTQNKCQRVSCLRISNKWGSEDEEAVKVRSKYTFLKEIYVNFYNNELFNWDFTYKHFCLNVDKVIKSKLPNRPVISKYNEFDGKKTVYSQSVGLSECLNAELPTKMYLEFSKVPNKEGKVNSLIEKVTKYVESLFMLEDLAVTVMSRERKNSTDVRIIYTNLVMPNLHYCKQIAEYLEHFNGIRTDIYKDGTVLDQYGTLKRKMGINVLRNDNPKENKFILVQPELRHEDINFLKDEYKVYPTGVGMDILKVRKSGILETEKVNDNFNKCKLLRECNICNTSHTDAYVLRYECAEYLCCPNYGMSNLLLLPYFNKQIDGTEFTCKMPESNVEPRNKNYEHISFTVNNNDSKEVLKLKYATLLLAKLSGLKGIKKDSKIAIYNRLYNYKKYDEISLTELRDSFAYLYDVFKIKDNEFKRLYYNGGKIPETLPEEYNFKQFNGLLKSMLKGTYYMEPVLNKPYVRKGATSVSLILQSQ